MLFLLQTIDKMMKKFYNVTIIIGKGDVFSWDLLKR